MYIFDQYPDACMGGAIALVALCVIYGIGAMG